MSSSRDAALLESASSNYIQISADHMKKQNDAVVENKFTILGADHQRRSDILSKNPVDHMTAKPSSQFASSKQEHDVSKSAASDSVAGTKATKADLDASLANGKAQPYSLNTTFKGGKEAQDSESTPRDESFASNIEQIGQKLQEEFENTRDEVARMTSFTQSTAKFAANTGKLAYYEALLNLKYKSKIAALSAIAAPLALFAWLGFSFTVALLVSETFASAALGALAFTMIQVLAIALVLLKRTSVKRKSGMKHTKESFEAFRHAYRGENHKLGGSER